MCTGTQATTACGHQLTHYTSKCEPKQEKPQCRNQLSKASIDDTCADCHPQIQQQMLHANHDRDRSQTLEQWREARDAGDEEKMREIDWEIMIHVNRTREQNFKASFGKSKGDDVQWKIRGRSAVTAMDTQQDPHLCPLTPEPSLEVGSLGV